MPTQNNVNIKIELCKDKSTNNLTLVLHFSNKSPNVTIEDNKYYWYPTSEEKNLINDSFNLISGKIPKPSVSKTTSDKTDVKKETENVEKFQELQTPKTEPKQTNDQPKIVKPFEVAQKTQEPLKEEKESIINDSFEKQQLNKTIEPQKQPLPEKEEDITPKVQINPPVGPSEEEGFKEDKKKLFQLSKKEPEIEPEIETETEIEPQIEPEPPQIMEPDLIQDEQPEQSDFEQNIPDVEDTSDKNKQEDKNKDNKNEDNADEKDDEGEDGEKIIVAADDAAIERALKKHTSKDDDESLVQADERLIIEKVLKQKKKGKWSKK